MSTVEPRIGSITPAPGEEEVAAIVAALGELWPRPSASVAATPTSNNAWRFSGRWWANKAVARRGRPGA